MTVMLKPLSEQVVVITGASSGIGLVTARAAAKAGAKVMLVARDGAALAAIVADIRAAGGVADHAVADVGVRAEVAAAAALAVARFGRIDSWINDAGVAIYAKLIDTPDDDHARMFRTNYFGVVHGCTIAIGHLRETGGAIITVGSIASDMPAPIMGAYAASKHAVKGYVDSLRIEVRHDRLPIAITLIKPAGIDTPIGEHAANYGVGTTHGEALIPPPVADPQRVADAILDAAVHPRRERTVGRVGRIETLFHAHFPDLFERAASHGIEGIFAPSPQTPGDNLFAPGEDGRERSRISPSLSRSLGLAGKVGASAAVVTLGIVAGGIVAAGGLALLGGSVAKRRS